MDSQEIQSRLDSLVAYALEKGLVTPRFNLEFQSQGAACGSYQWKTDANSNLKFEYVFGATLSDIFFQMTQAVNDTPSLEDRQREEYLKRLAAAIEYGKSIGLDEEFINPLALQMKKLSSNVIEHKYKHIPFEDEIPF